MLYVFDELDSIGDDIYEKSLPLLSKERCEKAQKLRQPLGKRASVFAYLLLRIALLENYGIDEAVEFVYSKNRKPLLRDYPHIHFNLSHSENAVVCAVSDVEVGVDVQSIRPVSDAVAKRVLTDFEYAAFKSSFIPDEYFCEIWTVKESFLKRTGQGITVELRELPVSDVGDKMVFMHKGYFYCVCGPDMEIKFLRREDYEKLYN
jgi:4'-phosphopantetheinyl transferase